MESMGSLVLLKKFKTIQQATAVTCGPTCVLMVLEHFGKRDGYNEKILKELRGTAQDTTYLRHLLHIFDSIGAFNYVSTFNYKTKEGIPENLFTDYLKRDNQDGYVIRLFCRFYEDNWKNRYDPDYDWGLFLAVWPE